MLACWQAELNPMPFSQHSALKGVAKLLLPLLLMILLLFTMIALLALIMQGTLQSKGQLGLLLGIFLGSELALLGLLVACFILSYKEQLILQVFVIILLLLLVIALFKSN